MNRSEQILEFDKIKVMLCSYAVSEQAKQILSELKPSMSERECRKNLDITTQARRILDSMGNPPLPSSPEILKIISLCKKGTMLFPEQLEAVSSFLAACRRMKQYLKRSEFLEVSLAYYGQSIYDISDLQDEIDSCIQNTAVSSSASPALKNIRRKIEVLNSQIKKKLEDLLRSRKDLFSDHYVVTRNGRFALPVKKDKKSLISGTVIDVSSTGGTYFIEPAAVARLQEELGSLQIEEEVLVQAVLYTLTASVEAVCQELFQNHEVMTSLDIHFAKGKLSAAMKAVAPVISTDRRIEIEEGRHPLLKDQDCVPLNFSIGGEVTGIVITGPNTGGKTVALKTVGLLSMMAQCGLHVPAKGGKFTMNNVVLCDIGDGQSITENLSTFSAHIKNVIQILEVATCESLVLLDELGSGTDPAEGMGIAISILEELQRKECLFLATTHYPEVKEYALKTGGLLNARMAFDKDSLKPLYQLELGEAGESCALFIARRLGFPEHMLLRAHQAAYHADILKAAKPDDFPIVALNTGNPARDQVRSPEIQKEKPARPSNDAGAEFQLGDSVTVLPDQHIGIVYQAADELGMVGVQVKGVKSQINYKRLKKKNSASELYPPDYDFSILFDTVENRKARHQMRRKHVPGLTVEIKKPNQ